MVADVDEVGALRRRVRADQRVRSVPLLVVGVLLVNYGADTFRPFPVPWVYAAPLAFVAMWALSRTTEFRTGVGAGRADYLAAAAFVFVASAVVTVWPLHLAVNDPGRIPGVWTLIVAAALAVIGLVGSDRVLVGGAAVAAVAGIFVLVEGGQTYFASAGLADLAAGQIDAWAGVVLVVAGLWSFRAERARA